MISETLRTFKLLLAKNLLLRQRHWKTNFIGEICVPILLVLGLWMARHLAGNLTSRAPVNMNNNTLYEGLTKDQLVDIGIGSDHLHIYFTPDNSFTRSLINKVATDCLRLNLHNITLHGYEIEKELEFAFAEIESRKSRKVVGVVFHNDQHDPSFSYKIRTRHFNEYERFNILSLKNMSEYYSITNLFVQMQLCIDEEFINKKTNDTTFRTQISIERLPYPPYTKRIWTDDLFREILCILIVVAFMFPLLIETAQSSSEKFLGLNVLLYLHGISDALNLLSFLIGGLLFISTFVVLPIMIFLVMPSGETLPFLFYGNPFIVWIIFSCYVVHLLASGIHFSAYFNRCLFVSMALLISNIIPMSLLLHGMKGSPLLPYLGVIFPNIFLHRVLEEMNYYETIAEGVHWNNMFVVGIQSYGLAGSIGALWILSLIGSLIQFSSAVYVFKFKSGKYSFKKQFSFLFKTRMNNKFSNDDQNELSKNEINKKNIEPINKESFKSIIKVRNLTKKYNIGMTNKMKINVLNGISMDFYETQITSILSRKGSGKSTFLSIIAGLVDPSDGSVNVDREKVDQKNFFIGFCMESKIFFPDLTIFEQFKFLAKLRMKNEDRNKVKDHIIELLMKIKLHDKKDNLAKTLREDEKKRLCIGMALVGNPKILILDEPTSGLDLEDKHLIWDILLKTRHEKTIILSTNDIEEADVLSDRIAILHSGLLMSYGTSDFLKKILGEGTIEIILNVDNSFNFESILTELNGETNIVNRLGNKVIIKVHEFPELPKFLDRLEMRKSEYGIKNFTVFNFNLERAYLSAIQVDEDPKISYETLSYSEKSVSGRKLFFQMIRALLWKKFTYTKKNLITILLIFLMVPKALLSITFVLKETSVTKPSLEIIPFHLGLYQSPETCYTSNNEIFGAKYKLVTEAQNGIAVKISNPNFSNELLMRASQDFSHYDNHLIGATFLNISKNNLNARIYYSEKMTFSLPISINLVSNAILKGLINDSYSIKIAGQQLSTYDDFVYTDSTEQNALTVAIMFSFLSFSALTLFVLHPSREQALGLKHMQRMTGVSGFAYWFTIFIFDLFVFMLVVIVLLGSLLILDYTLNFDLYHLSEVALLLFLFVLFAASLLPLVYIFSFLNLPTISIVRILTFLPMGIVSLELLMHLVFNSLNSYSIVHVIRSIQKRIFLLTPYISFLHSQISFYTTIQTNSRCRWMPNTFYEIECQNQSSDSCCNFKCFDGACLINQKLLTNFDKDINLEESLIYLCFNPIIYFGILFVLEYQLLPKNVPKIMKDENHIDSDESITDEKRSVIKHVAVLEHCGNNKKNMQKSLQEFKLDPITIQEYSSNLKKANEKAFLVANLGKKFNNNFSIKDINFEVDRNESFGIIGNNEAGKSAICNLISGKEVANSGTMFVDEINFRWSKREFFSKLAYCPQNNAHIDSLNAHDHLRLFARLRGIPENNIDAEVKKCIEKLNLSLCANQPSGTYSNDNQKRLNLAMALIGSPKVILFDEPTTNVEPETKNFIWNVIKACKTNGQTILLTSKSVEECEVLCDKLAIMIDGKFACIGPTKDILNRFTTGYTIKIKLNPGKSKKNLIIEIKNNIEQILECKIIEENLIYTIYFVETNNSTWEKMYDIKKEMQRKYDCIETISISSMSLEQSFPLFFKNNCDRTENLSNQLRNIHCSN
ncbi:hypothetical protein TKK_0001506 [Trichogramma kaykai]